MKVFKVERILSNLSDYTRGLERWSEGGICTKASQAIESRARYPGWQGSDQTNYSKGGRAATSGVLKLFPMPEGEIVVKQTIPKGLRDSRALRVTLSFRP